MKTTFLSLFVLLASFLPSESNGAQVTLEPYSKEQAIEYFHTKEFVEIDPEDLSPLNNSSSTISFVFSDEEKAAKTTSYFKKKVKPDVKILSLEQYLSSAAKLPSPQNTFVSLSFENALSSQASASLLSFVSKGGVVHLNHVCEGADGIEFIKSFYQKSSFDDPSIHCILSGDGVIVYSAKHHTLDVSPLLEACTDSFLENTDTQDLLKVEKTILSSLSSKDLPVFDWMERQILASKEVAPLYPVLWKGLFYLEQKEYLEASRCFHKALASGVDNWRVYWYISLAETERRNYAEAKRALLHVLHEVPDFKEAQVLLQRIEEV